MHMGAIHDYHLVYVEPHGATDTVWFPATASNCMNAVVYAVFYFDVYIFLTFHKVTLT